MKLGNAQTIEPPKQFPKLRVLRGGTSTQTLGKVGVDIDSTLYCFEAAARDVFLRLYEATGERLYLRGHYDAWQEWRSPVDICGLEAWLKVISIVHRPEMIESRTPFPGAVETLTELVESGYSLAYVSNRNPESAKATENWLSKCSFPDQGAEVHCLTNEKADHLAGCRYLIDDRPKTLIDFVYDQDWPSGSRQAFGLLYNYNRALTDISNIYLAPSWRGIRGYLVKHGILEEK